MKKIPTAKILIGYHKPTILFKNNVLTPIHLGRDLATAASKDGKISPDDYQWLVDNMVGDNTGDNISSKNRLYAELTGLYWAWKNYDQLGNPDYIGFMHYRRLLNFSKDTSDKKFNGLADNLIAEECKDTDIVLSEELGIWCESKKAFLDNIYEQYAYEHNRDDLLKMQKIIETDYPQFKESLEEVIHHRKKISWYGIFVMKKSLFFEYADFIFGVFKKLEKVVEWEKYDVTQQRVCGYLSEFLLNVFVLYKNKQTPLKIKKFPLYRIADSEQSRRCIGRDVHICFGTDNGYIEHTAVAIASVLSNANALDKYHFYIFSNNISFQNKKKILKLKAIKPFTINYVSISDDKLKIFEKIRRPEHISMSAYYRLLIPQALPDLDRSLYLDSDLIVLTDLNPLINLDMEDAWFAGVEDINAPNLARCIKLTDSKYINSGVLLINNELCLKNNYYNVISSRIKENSQNYYIADQDTLNDAFHDNIKLISYRYNMFFKFHKLLGNFKPTDKADFEYSCKHPVVVHFVGKDKPWLPNSQHPYKRDYEYYLSLTPWAKQTHNTFRIIQKTVSPTCKTLYVMGIPVKKKKIKANKVIKKFFGIPYAKKIVKDKEILETKFWGLLRKQTYIKTGETKTEVIVKTVNQIQEKPICAFKKFVFPYTLYGPTPTMLNLAEAFSKNTNETAMQILYMAMVLESGDEEKAIELINDYVKKYKDKDFERKLNLAYFAATHGFSSYPNIITASKIYERFELVENSQCLENLFYNKTIAIVGNGPSHIGKKKGKEIDSHDIVIRINNYATDKSYAEDYGSKTDVWLVGCGGDDVLLKKENFKAVIFGQDVRYFWGYHYDFYKYFILEKQIPCMYVPQDIVSEFQSNFNLTFGTTGGNFIYFLQKKLGTLKNVDFYGFNFCQEIPDEYATHYFPDQSLAERKARSNGHNFAQEALALKKLINESKK